MLKPLFRVIPLCAVLALTGCINFNVTGPIGAPLHPAATPSPRIAQVADVEVSAANLDPATRQSISRSLTQQLDQYVTAAGYFKGTSHFPTALGEQDVQLKFEMTSLKGRRAPHPGYFPGAILTLTIWIWVNGPIYVDSFDVAGNLVVLDRNGNTLARAADEVKLQRNVGLYGREYWAPTLGAAQLRQLVAQLLDTASARLAQQP